MNLKQDEGPNLFPYIIYLVRSSQVGAFCSYAKKLRSASTEKSIMENSSKIMKPTYAQTI